jgi:glycosyltransferase involved in cell wall biosynthesis
MKIAILHPSMEVKGGAENVVYEIAVRFSERGHSITIFTSGYSRQLWGIPRRFAVYELKKISKGRPNEWLALGKVLATKLRDFDLINPHNFPAYILAYGAKLSLGERLPAIIWYCHEPLRSLYRKITDPKGFRFYPQHNGSELKAIDKKAVSQIDHIICNSRFTANNVKKIFNREATVCHPGITVMDTPACPKKHFRTVTRLYKEKNVERIIQAMMLIRERRPDIYENCCLEVVGEGADENRLKTMVKDAGLSQIKFCGYLPDHQLPAFYAGAKALIYIPLDEPFGRYPLKQCCIKLLLLPLIKEVFPKR